MAAAITKSAKITSKMKAHIGRPQTRRSFRGLLNDEEPSTSKNSPGKGQDDIVREPRRGFVDARAGGGKEARISEIDESVRRFEPSNFNWNILAKTQYTGVVGPTMRTGRGCILV